MKQFICFKSLECPYVETAEEIRNFFSIMPIVITAYNESAALTVASQHWGVENAFNIQSVNEQEISNYLVISCHVRPLFYDSTIVLRIKWSIFNPGEINFKELLDENEMGQKLSERIKAYESKERDTEIDSIEVVKISDLKVIEQEEL